MRIDIDFRLFPNIQYKGDSESYTNYDHISQRMIANSYIPLLQIYDSIEEKHLLFIGDGSLGKSTSLKILEAELLYRSSNYRTNQDRSPICWLYECKRLDVEKIEKIANISRDFDEGVFLFDAYDELPEAETIRDKFLSLISELDQKKFRIIISSRFDPKDSYDNACEKSVFEGYEVLRLCRFKDEQLDSLVSQDIDRESGYYSLLKFTMFLNMHLEMEKRIPARVLTSTIKTEAEFIKQYFFDLSMQKNGRDMPYECFVWLGRYVHRQRTVKQNRYPAYIPDELQHIFHYHSSSTLDAIQNKYLNYVHAVYLKEKMLESMNDCNDLETASYSQVLELFDLKPTRDFSETFYYLGQLLRSEADDGVGLIQFLNGNFSKISQNYCNVLSLVCGYDNDVLRDTSCFKLIYEKRDVLVFNTRLSEVRGLRHFVVPEGISTIGTGVFYNCGELENITISSNVVDIGRAAFFRCNSLESIVFSDNVKIIHDSAFWECSNLKHIVLPPYLDSINDSAFYGCNNLQSINVPANVNKIGTWVFSCCSALETITVESGNRYYKSFGNCLIDSEGSLLAGCKNSQIPNDDSIMRIAKGAFWGQQQLKRISIPRSVCEIGSFAFTECEALEQIIVDSENPVYISCQNCLIESKTKTLIVGCQFSKIPEDDSVLCIGESAFQGCTKLRNLFIPKNIIKIERDAFRGCCGIETIEVDSQSRHFISDQNCLIELKEKRLVLGCKNSIVPSDGSVQTIGEGAFRGCVDLTTVIVPKDIICIEDMAFSGCSNVENFVVDPHNSRYGVIAKCLIDFTTRSVVAGCKNSVLSDLTNITTIGKAAFDGCYDLVNLMISNSVVRVLDFAFRNCLNVMEVALRGQIESIGYSSFRGCTRLRTVRIGKNLKRIGDAAFMDCNNLTRIVYEGSEEEWELIEKGPDSVPNTIGVVFLN